MYQGTFETFKQNIEKNCSLENNNFILKFQNKLKLKDNKLYYLRLILKEHLQKRITVLQMIEFTKTAEFTFHKSKVLFFMEQK